MRRNLNLTEGQIELLMSLLKTFIQILKVINPKKFSTENELQKISEYTDLYEIIASQYYEEEKFFKNIS